MRRIFNALMVLTMIPIMFFIAGVLFLIEYEDKKNPGALH